MQNRSVNTIARTLIQTVVRQKLTAIKNDPERSLRSLVDMGLNFAGGREQQHILQLAQQALQDESSAYYRIIYDMALHINTDHLLGFGMNFGYNSLTAGARHIRRLETESNCDIPWCLTLVIGQEGFAAHEDAYTALIEQGKKLGIYTYLLLAPQLPVGLFSLLQSQKDCAFLVFTGPEELTDDVIDSMAQLTHVMPVVRFGTDAEEVCEAMRRREMLYAAYRLYSPQTAGADLLEDTLLDTGRLHAPLTFFIEEGPRPIHTSPLYGQTISIRNDLHFDSVPVELWEDLHYIDSAISPRPSRCAVFDADCRLLRPDGSPDDSLSFAHLSLEDILSARR